MTAETHILQVPLEASLARRIEKAAALVGKTPVDFLVEVGEAAAHRLLLDWGMTDDGDVRSSLTLRADDTGLTADEMLSEKTHSGVLDPLDAQVADQQAEGMPPTAPLQRADAEKAADVNAYDRLLDWAVAQYRSGGSTYSQIAEQTGLAIEEIMCAMSAAGRDEVRAIFRASLARRSGDGIPQVSVDDESRP